MYQQTFHDAMKHWGDYFKKGLPPKTQDIYWKEVQYFSDAAMNAAKDYVPRHCELFPKLVYLLPLMQQMEERHGPRKRFEAPSEAERYTGFGEWSERNLVKEALGWKPLLAILEKYRFQDEAAIERIVEQGKRYKHDLDKGLEAVGLVPKDCKDPIGAIEATWEYDGDKVRKKAMPGASSKQLEVEGFKKIAAEAANNKELPF